MVSKYPRRKQRGIQRYLIISLCYRGGGIEPPAAMVHSSPPQAAGHLEPFSKKTGDSPQRRGRNYECGTMNDELKRSS
jgi:hypothetical protein